MKLLSFLISVAIHIIFIAAYLFFMQIHTIYKESKKIYTVDIVPIKTVKKNTVTVKKTPKKIVKKKIEHPKPKLKSKPKPKPKLKPKPKPKPKPKKNINRLFQSMIEQKIKQLKNKIKEKEIENLREKLLKERIETIKKDMANKVLNGQKQKEIAYSYIQLIKNIIYSNWGVEKSLLNNNRYTTDVDIRLDFRGNLIYLKIVRSSGNAYFDGTIMEAIKNSEPFPRPPKEILENGFVEFIIKFDSEEKK